MNEKPKRKLGWRLLRWGLIALAMLITLAAVLVTEENWRGKHEWEAFKHAAEARGERFEWTAFAPTNVPDDRNFFRAPIVAEAMKLDHDGTNGVSRMNFNIYRGEMANWITNGGNWQKGILTDLTVWQDAFRKYTATPEGRTNGFPTGAQPQSAAADVLLALNIFNPELEELRQASQRPMARLPLNYDNGFEDVGTLMPGLATEKRWA